QADAEVALVLPERRLDLRHGHAHGADSTNFAYRNGERTLLLRRRLPVLVHGVAHRRAGRGRGHRRGRMAAVRAASSATAPARGARRSPALRLDPKCLPPGAGPRDRDPPAAVSTALDAAPRRVSLGGRAGALARVQARPLR